MAVCLIFALSAIVSTLYVVWVYRQRQEDALFLTRLVHRDVRVGIGCAVIALYIALSLSGYGLQRPWGAVVIVAALLLMMYGPTDDALLWRRERQTPPARRQGTYTDEAAGQ